MEKRFITRREFDEMFFEFNKERCGVSIEAIHGSGAEI